MWCINFFKISIIKREITLLEMQAKLTSNMKKKNYQLDNIQVKKYLSLLKIKDIKNIFHSSNWQRGN